MVRIGLCVASRFILDERFSWYWLVGLLFKGLLSRLIIIVKIIGLASMGKGDLNKAQESTLAQNYENVA